MASAAGYDYVAVGHVCLDVLLDAPRGPREQPGGSALYGGLQAARLGLRTLIVTRGEPERLRALLSPFADELELRIASASHTTTLETIGAGSSRRQRVRAWAGPIGADHVPERSSVLHIAPIARETPSRSWAQAQAPSQAEAQAQSQPQVQPQASFVGLTPQGLVRRWDPETGRIALTALDPADLPRRCDAAVISQTERASCQALLQRVSLVAVTAGEGPTEVHLPNGSLARVPPAPVAAGVPKDDLGAGDVFAAAFFVALREGRAPAQAAAFGNAAAAVRIAGQGPQAIGDRKAIERLLG